MDAIKDAGGFAFDLAVSPDSERRVEEYERMLESKRQDDLYAKYKASGVPAKFFGSSLESYNADTAEESRIKDTVLAFAENPCNRVLIMCGNHGNGKTMLGCGIVRKCGGVYALSSDICVEYEAATSYKAKRNRLEVLKHYCECPMLVVDECGKYALDTELEKFIQSYILCGRYERNKPSVFITNGSKKRYIDFLGKSAFDRLTECCTTIEFNMESSRKSLRNRT